jgi:hypothetical protein
LRESESELELENLPQSSLFFLFDQNWTGIKICQEKWYRVDKSFSGTNHAKDDLDTGMRVAERTGGVVASTLWAPKAANKSADSPGNDCGGREWKPHR